MTTRKLKVEQTTRSDEPPMMTIKFNRPLTYLEFIGVTKLIEDQIKGA